MSLPLPPNSQMLRNFRSTTNTVRAISTHFNILLSAYSPVEFVLVNDTTPVKVDDDLVDNAQAVLEAQPLGMAENGGIVENFGITSSGTVNR